MMSSAIFQGHLEKYSKLGDGNWFTYPKMKGDFFLKVYYYYLVGAFMWISWSMDFNSQYVSK